MICGGRNVGRFFPYKYEHLYLPSSHEFPGQREDKMGMWKCYLIPLRDIIKAVHFSCNFSFVVSKAFLKPNILFVLPFRKEQAHRNRAEILMGIAKPVGHVPAQTDRYFGCRRRWLLRGWCLREAGNGAGAVPSTFHLAAACFPSGKTSGWCYLWQSRTADLCPTAPRGPEDGATRCGTRGVGELSTPRRSSVRGILRLSVNPVSPAPFCTAVNFLLPLSLKSVCLGEFQLLGEIPIGCKLL